MRSCRAKISQPAVWHACTRASVPRQGIQVCQGGNILYRLTGPAQATVGRREASPFLCCPSLQQDQSTKEPTEGRGRLLQINLAKATQEWRCPTAPSHTFPCQPPPQRFPEALLSLAWTGAPRGHRCQGATEELQPAPRTAPQRCLLLPLPSTVLIQRRLKSGCGKHRSCRGNRPFLAAQPPRCRVAGRAARGRAPASAGAARQPPTPAAQVLPGRELGPASTKPVGCRSCSLPRLTLVETRQDNAVARA